MNRAAPGSIPWGCVSQHFDSKVVGSMKRLFAWVVLVLGAWTAVSPWVLGYTSVAVRWSDCVVGLLTAGLSLVVILHKGELRPSWPQWTTSLLGLWLVVSAFVFGPIRWSCLICGILIAALSLFATQVIEGRKVTVYTKDGKVLLEMSSMTYKEDGQIELKGKTFGTMPALMYVRPVDVWNLLGIIPFVVIRRLPRILIAGGKDR